jgi:hypothetical protein
VADDRVVLGVAFRFEPHRVACDRQEKTPLAAVIAEMRSIRSPENGEVSSGRRPAAVMRSPVAALQNSATKGSTT